MCYSRLCGDRCTGLRKKVATATNPPTLEPTRVRSRQSCQPCPDPTPSHDEDAQPAPFAIVPCAVLFNAAHVKLPSALGWVHPGSWPLCLSAPPGGACCTVMMAMIMGELKRNADSSCMPSTLLSSCSHCNLVKRACEHTCI